jgi:ABC-type transport system substrate-binding protein
LKKKIIALIVILSIGIASIPTIFWIMNFLSEPQEELRVSRTANPVTMDPCDSWDSISNNMLDQVVETLIAYNLSAPNFPLVGRLAESWDYQNSAHGTNITFQLRPNIFFHDGALFTGECVIHTFKRINFFGNWTGTLTAPHHMAFPHSLYKFADGRPIFNDTLSFVDPSDPLDVTLVLNGPFAPVEGLLAYTASSIVHPDSTPEDAMLELGTDLVVGTGPFKLVHYIPNSEVRFARWNGYWRTPADWGEIVYVYYTDAVSANNAMLAGDIDYLGQGIASLKPDFETDPDITVTGNGINPYITGSIYWYIAFNSEFINLTWRKAMCHAFNYTYFIHNIEEDNVVKANSLVPPGFPAHNSSVVGGTFNIPYARQIMQSMGFGVGLEIGTQVWGSDDFTPGGDEALWKAASWVPEEGNFSGKVFNFRHRQGNQFLELLIDRFIEDMDLIGIQIQQQILTWDEFIELGENHPERIHVFFVGLGSDYFETFKMIDPLVSNASSANYAHINDPHIQDLLNAAVAETNTTARYALYKRLQGYIHDVQFYHMRLEYDKLYFVHAANLKGFPYNCMRFFYWYPTYRV